MKIITVKKNHSPVICFWYVIQPRYDSCRNVFLGGKEHHVHCMDLGHKITVFRYVLNTPRMFVSTELTDKRMYLQHGYTSDPEEAVQNPDSNSHCHQLTQDFLRESDTETVPAWSTSLLMSVQTDITLYGRLTSL